MPKLVCTCGEVLIVDVGEHTCGKCGRRFRVRQICRGVLLVV